MKPMSSLVMFALAKTSAITGMSISTSFAWSTRRSDGDWANEQMATGRFPTTGFGALTGTP